MLGKYTMKGLGNIHLILECVVLCDEATGDYLTNHRHHYVIGLRKSTFRLGELERRRLYIS